MGGIEPAVFFSNVKGKGTKICIAPHRENPEALRYESHSFYPENTLYLHLPRKLSPDGATQPQPTSLNKHWEHWPCEVYDCWGPAFSAVNAKRF